MLTFSTRNAVIVALVQVAIIVAGVLASGLSHKWWATDNIPLPRTTLFLIDYGVVILGVPVIWIASVLYAKMSTRLSDGTKALGFLSGFVVMLALIVLIGHAVITPWRQHHFPGIDRAPEDAYYLPDALTAAS